MAPPCKELPVIAVELSQGNRGTIQAMLLQHILQGGIESETGLQGLTIVPVSAHPFGP
jgi:hypothetical protein